MHLLPRLSYSAIPTAGVALFFFCIAACGGPVSSSQTSEPEEAPLEPAPPPEQQQTGPAFVETPVVEAGFEHCCGTLDYKLEVECGDRLKRCYANEGGEWKQTYGRHCKAELGETCYLHTCDDVCGS